MAFRNETISKVNIERFNSFNFKNPVTDLPVRANEWTIDHERNAFLVRLGGQGLEFSEIPMYYAFVWENNINIIETFRKGRGDAQSGVELWWKITCIEALGKLNQDGKILIEMIKEAFIAYGNGINCEHVKKVNFEFVSGHAHDKNKSDKTCEPDTRVSQTADENSGSSIKNIQPSVENRSTSIESDEGFIKKKFYIIKNKIMNLPLPLKYFYFMLLVMWIAYIVLNFSRLLSDFRFIQYTSLLVLMLSLFTIVRSLLLFFMSPSRAKGKATLGTVIKALLSTVLSVLVYGITL